MDENLWVNPSTDVMVQLATSIHKIFVCLNMAAIYLIHFETSHKPIVPNIFRIILWNGYDQWIYEL